MSSHFRLYVGLAAGCLAPALSAASAPPHIQELPPGYVPCKIVKQEPTHFPPQMVHEGIPRGEAHVMIEIGPDGQITDCLVTAYTNRAFAEEGRRIARASRYAPGQIDGQPVISMIRLQFVFEMKGTMVSQHYGFHAEQAGYRIGQFEYFPHAWTALDRKPNPLHTPGPIYPRAWIEEGRRGTVVVRFYIDETGQVRMPTVRETPDEFLGSAATAAVKEWRFEPPLRKGRPVLIQVDLPVVFQAETKTFSGTREPPGDASVRGAGP